MRVLLLTNMYPTADHPIYGTFVRDQVESLAALGIEAQILFVDGRGSETAYLRAIAAVGRAARGPFDLLHAHYGLSGFLGVTQRRLPVVITFHGDDLEGTPSPGGGLTRKSRAVMALGRWAAKRAAAVIVVSERLRGFLPRGRAREDAHVIPMGIDMVRFHPSPRGEACAKLGLDPGRRRVVFAADPANFRKRHPLAVAAVEILSRDLPDVDLHVVHGVPPDHVPDHMNASDLLMLTSVNEGSPMVVKEALACNLPIVSVDVGDVAERIRGVALCRVAPPRPDALADAAREVLAAGARSDGRSAVESLSLPSIARRVASVYEGVALPPPPPSRGDGLAAGGGA